jgi:hypothetical protein
VQRLARESAEPHKCTGRAPQRAKAPHVDSTGLAPQRVKAPHVDIWLMSLICFGRKPVFLCSLRGNTAPSNKMLMKWGGADRITQLFCESCCQTNLIYHSPLSVVSRTACLKAPARRRGLQMMAADVSKCPNTWPICSGHVGKHCSGSHAGVIRSFASVQTAEESAQPSRHNQVSSTEQPKN